MFLKRTLPISLAFIFGWLAIGIEYIPHPISEKAMGVLTKGMILVGATTIFLGVYSLLRMHYLKIRRRMDGWGYSILVWIGFTAMVGAGFYNEGQGFLNPQVEGGWVRWLYIYIFTPCQSSMFSILAFFIASAAYRSFRAKSFEAGVLLLAAVIVMFGTVPVSTSVWSGFPELAQYLLSVPNLAVKRAIFFGIALGGIATSLRIIFGIERSYLGGE
jgi:hypothetical protein